MNKTADGNIIHYYTSNSISSILQCSKVKHSKLMIDNMKNIIKWRLIIPMKKCNKNSCSKLYVVWPISLNDKT